MNRLKYSVFLFFILISLACQTQLPTEVPGDLEITFNNQSGERLYEGGSSASFAKSVIVKGNEMTVELSRCQKVEKVTLNEQEVKSFYQSFVKSEFDLIRSEQSPTNNGNENGFKEISLKAGNISKNVKFGKQFPLSEKDTQRFNSLWTTMLDIAYEKVKGC